MIWTVKASNLSPLFVYLSSGISLILPGFFNFNSAYYDSFNCFTGNW